MAMNIAKSIDPTTWSWSGVNTYNQNAAAVTIPANSAIMALEVNAAGYDVSVLTKCVLWEVGGAVLRQSSTFTMAVRTEGDTIWQGAKTITPYVVSSQKTFWVGLYRNPSGRHQMGRGTSGTGYRKTNTGSNPVTMSGYNSYADHRWSVRAYYIQKPSTPTGIGVSRTSDTKYTISWTRSSTDTNPITYIYVERYNNVSGTWSQIAKLGNVASYVDTGTIANRSYKWRVRAWNDAGYSSYLTTISSYKTTPANATNVVAVRSGANVIITWTRQDTAADNYIVERSIDDGDNYTELTDSLAGTATTYTDTSPDTTNIYKIKAIAGTLTNTGTISNSVQMLSAPAKPTNLAPTALQAFDYEEVKTFTWQHNSLDTSIQSKFSLDYAEDEAFTTGLVSITEEATANNYYEFAAETFANGTTYYWKVKTWGSHADGSSWSDTSTFKAISKPEAVLTVPDTETAYTQSILIAQWTYTDINDLDQSQYIIGLYDENDVLLEQKTGTSIVADEGTDTVTFDYKLENATNYYVTLQVRNSEFLLSAEVKNEFTTLFQKPSIPELTLTDNLDGTVTIDIFNPAAGSGEEETSYNRVFRKVFDQWELVYDDVDINSSIIDNLPSIYGTTYYYVESVSAVPTSNFSYEYEIEIYMGGVFILNSGDDYQDSLAVIGDIDFNEKIDREKELLKFAGRQKPLKFEGEHTDRTISLSGMLEIIDYEKYLTLISNTGDCYYRDWRGRHFKCDISTPSVSKEEQWYKVYFSISEVE